MAEVIEEGRLFTFDELRILFFAYGVKEIKGVYMPEKSLTPEEILFVLYHMTEKGMIKAEEVGFTIREDIREMLQIMGYPETSFVENEYYCYVSSGQVVVSEQYWKKKDTVKLRIFSLEKFEEWREEMRDSYDYC